MTAPLETYCTLLTDGTHYTPVNAGTGFPFLTVADMQPEGLNFSSCSRITSEDFDAADRQNSAPKAGDVLFSKDGTVGKVHVVDGEAPFAVLSSIAIIRPDRERLDPNYLAHFLRTPEAISAADRSKTGSALRRIILKDIKRLLIDPPDLYEQQRIAAILDQADALRRLRRQSLSRLSALGQSIFYEMFGDPKVGLADAEELSFGQACEDRTSKFDKIQKSEYQRAGIIPIIDQGQNTIAGWVDDADRVCHPDTGVVVFGDHTRAIKFVDFPFVIGADGAKVLTPSKRFDPLFFSELLRLLPIPELGYSRHMREVKKMMLPCPSLERQTDFSDRLSTSKATRNKYEAALAMADNLFASLQQRAFRGEL